MTYRIGFIPRKVSKVHKKLSPEYLERLKNVEFKKVRKDGCEHRPDPKEMRERRGKGRIGKGLSMSTPVIIKQRRWLDHKIRKRATGRRMRRRRRRRRRRRKKILKDKM